MHGYEYSSSEQSRLFCDGRYIFFEREQCVMFTISDVHFYACTDSGSVYVGNCGRCALFDLPFTSQ